MDTNERSHSLGKLTPLSLIIDTATQKEEEVLKYILDTHQSSQDLLEINTMPAIQSSEISLSDYYTVPT